MQQRMTEVAAADGLDFRFDLARGGNTFDAHRLVHLAEAHGLQDAMKERLMRAYLTEGELIGDPATLARLGARGRPARGRGARRARRRPLRRRGARGRAHRRRSASTPCRSSSSTARIGAAGAQPPEVLGELLRRGWETRVPA